ncbi:MAG: transcriptional regulator [Thermobacillus sp. ZCTH02-B1]|uniref:LCP family protein n=1 Tax=Thermobacillus sp. ZCTH02-B1 TaxID=1858795 RepID=UPI000B57D1AC|nr:LCP family protein [Thermobacillus sp. ZCTH02-B1]OUM93700.1 MAG: transcriptional regulator [Thermobacillus sp. ZCTH02-B1]
MRLTRGKVWAAGIAAGIALLGLAGYWFRTQIALAAFELLFADKVKAKLEQSYQPIARTAPEGGRASIGTGGEPEVAAAAADRPFTLLLLGIDSRKGERGRSDALIVTVVRPRDAALLIVSIPRDTRVEIPGRKKPDKIAHAYAYGGAALAVETVEKFLGLRIDHYASINFRGFREAIDAIGGIRLPVEKDLVNDDPGHEHFVVKAGQPFYNGEDALNYVRFREDAGGDASRARRQQIFLRAILDRASEIGEWRRIPELIDIMGNNFATDIPPDEMVRLAERMIAAGPHPVHSHTLKGAGRMEDGIWYFFADERDAERAKAWIRAWLDADAAYQELPKPDPSGPA